MKRSSDCRACGSAKTRHNQRDGWCWDGGIFEDATTYERLGWWRLMCQSISSLWQRLRPPTDDLSEFSE